MKSELKKHKLNTSCVSYVISFTYRISVYSTPDLIFSRFFANTRLSDTYQDSYAFHLLELIEILVKKLKVPSESWDFVLCSLVTLTQVDMYMYVLCSMHFVPIHT